MEITLKMKCNPEHIPLILKVIQANGTSWFNDNIWKSEIMYTFWLEFTKSLWDHQLGTPSMQTSKVLIVRCWEVLVGFSYGQPARKPSVDRIIDIVELCVRTRRPKPCSPLSVAILKERAPTKVNFTSFYEVLISLTVQTKDLDVCTPPFNQVMEVLIGAYLQNVVGPKSATIASLRTRNIECGCANCADVNRFLQSPSTELRVNKQPRFNLLHVCGYLNTATDLVTYTVGNYSRPTPVTVRKTPILLAYVQWAQRQTKAQAFLTTVGTDDVIAKVVGRT
ncbi:hypothetical protein D9758_004791 [Tetrapyrgos nigripes]|uniref:Uncharacterized protein n=1 Tax=Tetrapyrgos nigripes TaxID=182062 RepID=A0A8H5LIY7_9AGAR|nr:hypothetical protein D9758_004791 [Tetrapyrgos nigripes]